ncbi:MAG: protein kinase, partial [Planctomycetota bacterium]|nr:protein kinase [Planctomycetota bacterium]
MNPSTGNHPDKERLAAFGLGKLSTDESVWIENHLDECDNCNQTLVNLTDDTFAGVVRSLADSPAARRDFAANSDTEPDVKSGADTPGGERTDDVFADNDGNTSATILLPSSDPVEPMEVPDELKEHPRYCILELIGRGGMGDVYRAEHRLMNRPVAVKLINSQLIRNPQAVERFRREVQAAAQLAHPNIVTAYDAEQAGALHFLVMEFVDGTDLATVVEQDGPLPVSTACDYIR